MKQPISYNFWFMMIILTIINLSINVEIQAYPAPLVQGLLAPQYAISIRAGDFNAGPVVIYNPGYYILTHDIEFNPTMTTDPNGNTWGVSLLILSDNVTLDLNTYSLGQDSSIYNSPEFNLIQVGGLNVTDPDDLTIYTPKHITIKNGCLNGSQGYGIYGENNSNIHLYDLMVCECAIAGIFLSNLKCSSIQRCDIAGSSQGAGNVYGIFLRDNSSTTPNWTSDSQGTSGPEGVSLEDIKICDVYTNNSLNVASYAGELLTDALPLLNTDQLIAANSTIGVTPSIVTDVNLLISQITVLTVAINNAISIPTTNNITNALTAANTVNGTITSTITAINALFPTPGTPNYCVLLAVIQMQTNLEFVISAINQALTIINGEKDYINGVATTTTWHAYGIRITRGQAIKLTNCSVSGTSVDSSVVTATYAAAIALDACTGCLLQNCSTSNTNINLGLSIGISIATGSSGNYFSNCTSTGHTSNDATFGYWTISSNSQNFDTCEASSLQGISNAKGFYFQQANANHVFACNSFCHQCTLLAATNPAETIGFDSVGCGCNLFDQCQAYNLTADAAFRNTLIQTNLIAAGFRLQSYPDAAGPVTTYDSTAVITNSTARCIQGSGGTAAGILLNGSQLATLQKNVLSTSTSVFANGSIGGVGYGILDTAANTTALIIQNLAYANQTCNYQVTYTSPNEQLPVVIASYGDLTNLYRASHWVNVSLQSSTGGNMCTSPSGTCF